MNNNDKILNEMILTALVLTLSKQIDFEKKEKGTTRIGGDYTSEAVRLIKNKHSKIIALLNES